MVQNSRRTFIKGALVVGGVVATTSIALNAQDKGKGTNGVVSGKSNKKEILYKKTQNWEEYYKAAH